MKRKLLIQVIVILTLSITTNGYYYENNANYDAENNEFNKGDGSGLVHVPPDLLISTDNNNNNNDIDNEQIECKTDLNCVSSHSICLNGNCVRICNNNNNSNKQLNSNCIYFHCDSKLLVYSDNYYLINKKLKNLINNNNSSYSNLSSNLLFNNRNANFLIETNNYPLLNRYLSKKKCSWILKHRLKDKAKTKASKSTPFFSSPFIKLKFNRFSTQLSNDFLYIFAGDSIYSPLIAALR
jgi:hypothetical protein